MRIHKNDDALVISECAGYMNKYMRIHKNDDALVISECAGYMSSI